MDDKQQERKEIRQFGMIMAIFLPGIFGLLLPWLYSAASYPLWPWIAAALFGVTALAIPQLLTPIYTLWMRLAHVLGWINTRLLLGLIFFVIITPFGLLMRLFGKDPMLRRLHTNESSYRKPSKALRANHYERPF